MKHILIALAIIVVVANAITISLVAYENTVAEQQQESECIAKLISYGIERSDIIVTPGHCSVRK